MLNFHEFLFGTKGSAGKSILYPALLREDEPGIEVTGPVFDDPFRNFAPRAVLERLPAPRAELVGSPAPRAQLVRLPQ